MEILGIGPTELVFIILIAIIVLGPKEMEKTGRMIGRWLNQARSSELWKMVRDTSRDLSNLPNKWMREANLEMWEEQQDLKRIIDPRTGADATTQALGQPQADKPVHPSQSIPSPNPSGPMPEEKPSDTSDQHV